MSGLQEVGNIRVEEGVVFEQGGGAEAADRGGGSGVGKDGGEGVEGGGEGGCRGWGCEVGYEGIELGRQR